jgi:hypothetical protein
MSMLETVRGRAPDSPGSEIDVETVAEDGTRRRVPLASAARIPSDTTPARQIKARKGQQQRASACSLLRRLEAAAARIRRLEADNQQLRDVLGRILGERRAAEVSARPAAATRRRRAHRLALTGGI